MSEVGRNDPCPCGSGKKHKHCCLKDGGPGVARRAKVLQTSITVVIVLALILAFAVSPEAGGLTAVVGFAGIGLWLWLFAPPPRGGGNDPGAINFGR